MNPRLKSIFSTFGLPRRKLRIVRRTPMRCPCCPLANFPGSSPPSVGYVIEAYREVDRIARSVAGRSFDIVDVPDFVTFGGALKSAFANHGVSVGRLVLAMHGNISDTIDMNWGSTG